MASNFDLAVSKLREYGKKYRDKGWVFGYSEATKFIEGTHQLGGRFTLFEISPHSHPSRDAIDGGVAKAIVDILNESGDD